MQASMAGTSHLCLFSEENYVLKQTRWELEVRSSKVESHKWLLSISSSSSFDLKWTVVQFGLCAPKYAVPLWVFLENTEKPSAGPGAWARGGSVGKEKLEKEKTHEGFN